MAQSRESQGATKTYELNHKRAVRGYSKIKRDDQPKVGVISTNKRLVPAC